MTLYKAAQSHPQHIQAGRETRTVRKASGERLIRHVSNISLDFEQELR